MADFSGFFKRKKKGKEDEFSKSKFRAGVKGTDELDEQMRLVEEAQDRAREEEKKKKYKDGGVAKKSYFDKIKKMCKK